jgi:putative endonuclease
MGAYYVYIMTNKSRTLYTGVTSDLERRVFEHKKKLVAGFTSRYNITQLVWFDDFDDVTQAIEGEKKIKGWRRSKKVALIETSNPEWKDLAEDWFSDGTPRGSVDPSVAKAPSG